MKPNLRPPRFLADVLEAIDELKDRGGSSGQDIVKHIRARPNASSGYNTRNVSTQIQRALKHAVESGVVMQRAGKFRISKLGFLDPDCHECRRKKGRRGKGKTKQRRRRKRSRQHRSPDSNTSDHEDRSDDSVRSSHRHRSKDSERSNYRHRSKDSERSSHRRKSEDSVQSDSTYRSGEGRYKRRRRIPTDEARRRRKIAADEARIMGGKSKPIKIMKKGKKRKRRQKRKVEKQPETSKKRSRSRSHSRRGSPINPDPKKIDDDELMPKDTIYPDDYDMDNPQIHSAGRCDNPECLCRVKQEIDDDNEDDDQPSEMYDPNNII